MAAESAVMRRIWLALSGRRFARATLFRANSGKAILGGKPRYLPNGDVVVPFGRPIALGLALVSGDTWPGLPDLVGYTSVEITPEMVGRKVPVFTLIETKESGGGRKLKDQVALIQRMHQEGAIAGFAASEAQANEIIDSWIEGRTPSVM